MTEAEFLASDDPAKMLEYATLGRFLPLKVLTPRKLRLWACACCRQPEVWDGKECGRCGGDGKVSDHEAYNLNHGCPDCLGTGRVGGLTDPRSRAAVEVAERFADGEATDADMRKAYSDAQKRGVWLNATPGGDASRAAAWCAWNQDHQNAWNVFAKEGWPVPPATQATLLRCLIGNPWHRDMAWWRDEQEESHLCMVTGNHYEAVNWLTPTVVNLARSIYADRRWEALPILCDALEEAGCTNAEMLAHGRGAGPHGRGCWVLDLILGKE